MKPYTLPIYLQCVAILIVVIGVIGDLVYHTSMTFSVAMLIIGAATSVLVSVLVWLRAYKDRAKIRQYWREQEAV